MEPNDMKDLLDGWCQESSASTEKGYTCQWSFIDSEGQVAQSHSMTSTDVKVNPWYGVFANSLNRMGYKFETSVCLCVTQVDLFTCIFTFCINTTWILLTRVNLAVRVWITKGIARHVHT